MVNQEALDEIYELEELLASMGNQKRSDKKVVAELQTEIDRLKGKLYYDKRTFPLGGKISP